MSDRGFCWTTLLTKHLGPRNPIFGPQKSHIWAPEIPYWNVFNCFSLWKNPRGLECSWILREAYWELENRYISWSCFFFKESECACQCLTHQLGRWSCNLSFHRLMSSSREGFPLKVVLVRFFFLNFSAIMVKCIILYNLFRVWCFGLSWAVHEACKKNTHSHLSLGQPGPFLGVASSCLYRMYRSRIDIVW